MVARAGVEAGEELERAHDLQAQHLAVQPYGDGVAQGGAGCLQERLADEHPQRRARASQAQSHGAGRGVVVVEGDLGGVAAAVVANVGARDRRLRGPGGAGDGLVPVQRLKGLNHDRVVAVSALGVDDEVVDHGGDASGGGGEAAHAEENGLDFERGVEVGRAVAGCEGLGEIDDVEEPAVVLLDRVGHEQVLVQEAILVAQAQARAGGAVGQGDARPEAEGARARGNDGAVGQVRLLVRREVGEERIEVAPEVVPPEGDAGELLANAEEFGRDGAAREGSEGHIEAGGGAGVIEPVDRLDGLLQTLGGEARGLADVDEAAGGAGLVGGAILEAALERGAEAGGEHAHGCGQEQEEDEAAVVEGIAHHAPEPEQDGGSAEAAQSPRGDPQDHREQPQEDERDHQHEERGRDQQEGVGGEFAEEVFGHERAPLAELVEEEAAHAHENEVEVVAQEQGLPRGSGEALFEVHHARLGGAVGGPEQRGEGEQRPQRGHAERLARERHLQQLALAQVGEGRCGAKQADHPGGQQGSEDHREDRERQPLDQVDGHDLAEARAAALQERDLARLALHQHGRHQHQVVQGDADDEEHEGEEGKPREEQLLLVLGDDVGQLRTERGQLELGADGAFERAQVALEQLRVAAVDALAVDKGEGLEAAVDGGQVGSQHLDEGALVDDKGEGGPARAVHQEAVGVAEPVVLGGIDRFDEAGDDDLDGVDVVAPEGVEVEGVAGGDAQLVGGGGAYPDLDAGPQGGVGGGR